MLGHEYELCQNDDYHRGDGHGVVGVAQNTPTDGSMRWQRRVLISYGINEKTSTTELRAVASRYYILLGHQYELGQHDDYHRGDGHRAHRVAHKHRRGSGASTRPLFLST